MKQTLFCGAQRANRTGVMVEGKYGEEIIEFKKINGIISVLRMKY